LQSAKSQFPVVFIKYCNIVSTLCGSKHRVYQVYQVASEPS